MYSKYIWDWLDSVEPANEPSSEGPRKRARLNNGRASIGPIRTDHTAQLHVQITGNDHIAHLPTPSASDPGSVPLSRHSRMPAKRPRSKNEGSDNVRPEQGDPGDVAVLHTDITPRPRRSAPASLDYDEVYSLPLSLPSPSRPPSSLASSKASKISRNSSPTKQLRNAELEETGFLRASLRDDKKPKSLHALNEELRRITSGFGILPKDLQDDLVDDSIDFWNFEESPGFRTTVYPDLSTVRQIYELAKRCFKNNHPESSWNNDVHSRVLNWVLRDGPCKYDLVDYRCCLTAQVALDYQPINSPSKMVDYCICIEPETSSLEYRAIESLCRRRPGKSINHTDWADLAKYPIAVSIETKGPSIGYETALLQVATWHSAQWRSLHWGQQDRDSAHSWKIEFLPGIIVMQHHWWFVATTLNEEGKAQTFERILLGETESILGIYKLSMALQKLVEWARDQHWPAFQSDVLGL